MAMPHQAYGTLCPVDKEDKVVKVAKVAKVAYVSLPRAGPFLRATTVRPLLLPCVPWRSSASAAAASDY